MKLLNGQVFDLVTGLEKLLDQQLPPALSFQVADAFTQLEAKRRAIALAAKALPKKEGSDEVQSGPFSELLLVETDVEVMPLDREELAAHLGTIEPRVILSLKPLWKGDK